jgi:hypothetical protein
MKIALLSLLLACFSLPAFALDKAAIRRNHNACVKLLKMSRPEQEKVAKKAGYSWSRTVSACRLLVKNGVEKTWRLDQEYLRAKRKPGRVSQPKTPAPNPWNPPTCWGSRGCGPGSHCIRGFCSDTAYGCHSDGECTPGDSCVSGVCKD